MVRAVLVWTLCPGPGPQPAAPGSKNRAGGRVGAEGGAGAHRPEWAGMIHGEQAEVNPDFLWKFDLEEGPAARGLPCGAGGFPAL